MAKRRAFGLALLPATLVSCAAVAAPPAGVGDTSCDVVLDYLATSPAFGAPFNGFPGRLSRRRKDVLSARRRRSRPRRPDGQSRRLLQRAARTRTSSQRCAAVTKKSRGVAKAVAVLTPRPAHAALIALSDGPPFSGATHVSILCGEFFRRLGRRGQGERGRRGGKRPPRAGGRLGLAPPRPW